MGRDVAIAITLVLATAALYAPVAHHEFVTFDDPGYVFNNAHVTQGLTWSGLRWALVTDEEINWHPLAWLSHMLDWQCFGSWAGGHHLVSVGIHAANAVLVFWLLRRMTGLRWPAAMVAALFALHPLHVESVAWASERKDVLSTLLGLLSLLAYVRYAERPGVWRYVPVFVLLALGLMAKPMLVTLPCVMLLLDFWPLGRMLEKMGGMVIPKDDHVQSPSMTALSWSPFGLTMPPSWRTVAWRVLEKVPLLALAAASSVITYIVQQEGGAMKLAGELSFPTRVANALVAYVAYLGQMVWPAGLAVFYPYAEPPRVYAILAGAFLAAATALAVWQMRKRPYLAVGWFWYLGTLVPVIGLVQVGQQAMADRYTYIPLIGIFIAVSWGAADLLSGWRHRAKVLAPAAAAVLAALAVVAFLQVRTWQDSETLYNRALDVTTDNALAHNNLAFALTSRGRHEDAVFHGQEAIRIDPEYAAAHNNLAMALYALHRANEAVSHFREAIRIEPNQVAARCNLGLVLIDQGKFAEACANYYEAMRYAPHNAVVYCNLGMALHHMGRLDEAVCQYREALRLQPDMVNAYNNLGLVLSDQGRMDEAAQSFREALKRDPGLVGAHANLAGTLVGQQKMEEGIAEAREALRLDPGQLGARCNLGVALVAVGRVDEAIAQYGEVLRMKPDHATAHYNLAIALSRKGNTEEAAAHFAEALRLQPDLTGALNQLAWIRATAANPALRNAGEAVDMADRACQLLKRSDPVCLDTLAAAYAEAGRFPEAVAAAREAIALARSQNNPSLATEIEGRLKLYEAHQPYHEPK